MSRSLSADEVVESATEREALERVRELTGEVELSGGADLIELSGGAITFGLERSWFRGLNAAVPRKGVYREIGRLVGRAARERPATLPLIFIRGR